MTTWRRSATPSSPRRPLARSGLGWLPGAGYQLVVSSADRLLAQNSADYATFVALLKDVGRAWGTGATGHPGRGAVPFHTVLVVSAARLSKRRNWGAPPLAG